MKQLKNIGEKIYVPELSEDVIEQFDGYFNLRDIKIENYNEKGLPVYPDHNIGKGMADTERQDALQQDANTSRLIKQADAILAICQNPLDYSKEVMQKTFDFYLAHTLQFSSLSPGSYALAGAFAKRISEAYRLFMLAVNMDLKDIKNETETGLHIACHGGAYQSAVEGFAGIRGEKDFLDIDPVIPDKWESIELPLIYSGIKLSIKVEKQKVLIAMLTKGSLNIRYKGLIKSYSNFSREPLYITL